MVRCLNGDDISAEIWSQKETKGLDGVGFLGLASRETELSELLVWLQHHHVWTKYHSSFLLLVVVDLYGSIMWHSESNHLCLISLGWRPTRTS